MIFCRSGDTTSGFVTIKNGVEYCYFDYLALVLIIAMIVGIIIVLTNKESF